MNYSDYCIEMGKKILRKGKKPTKCLTDLYQRITLIQTDILNRFLKLKLTTKLQLCQHLQLSNICPTFDAEINYYDLYWRQFLSNELSKSQLLQFKVCLHYFQEKIRKIEELFILRQQLIAPYQKPKQRNINLQFAHNFVCIICKQQFEDLQAIFSHRQAQHTRKQQIFPNGRQKQENNQQDQQSNHKHLTNYQSFIQMDNGLK